jgi:diacylglycerol kinase
LKHEKITVGRQTYNSEMEEKRKSDRRFSIRARFMSFRAAFHGISTLLRDEHNARIHLAIFVLVVAAGLLSGISKSDWLAILLVSGLVFAAECFNTAVEHLADLIADEANDNIRKAKDVAAAGVLIAAIIAAATGLIIFIPVIYGFIRH